MSDSVQYEAELLGAAEASTELGKLKREVEQTQEKFDGLGGVSADAATQATAQWRDLNKELEEVQSRLKETVALYSNLMRQMMVVNGGNNSLKFVAGQVTGLPIEGVRHAASGPDGRVQPAHRPSVTTSQGEAVNAYSPGLYQNVPIMVPERLVTSEARILNAGGQTSREAMNSFRIANRGANIMEGRAEAALARGDGNDTANEFRYGAAGLRYEASFQAKMATALKAIEKHTEETNLLAETQRGLREHYEQINDLKAKETLFRGQGDQVGADNYQRQWQSKTRDSVDLIRRANDLGAAANPDAVPDGYHEEINRADGAFYGNMRVIREANEAQEDEVRGKANWKYSQQLFADRQKKEQGERRTQEREEQRFDKTYWSAVGQNDRFDQKAYTTAQKSQDASDKTYWSAYAQNDRFDAKRSDAQGKDYAKWWSGALKDEDRRNDLASKVEGAAGKGERRLVDIAAGGRAAPVDFSGLREEISEALKAGLIDQGTADAHEKRLAGVDRFRSVAGEQGEVNRGANSFEARIRKLMDEIDRHSGSAKRFDALGDKTGAEHHRREALRASREIISRMDQMTEMTRRLAASGQKDEANAFRGTMHEAKIKGIAAHEEFKGAGGGAGYAGGLGGWLRGEMHRMPGGRYASALFGDNMAKAINGGGSKMLGRFAASAAGQAAMNTTVGKAAMHGASRAMGGAVEVAGGSQALAAVATNPVTIALAVAGIVGYLGNKYANQQYDRGGSARQEEMQAGDIARRNGLSGRVLDDVRKADGQGGSGAVLGQYAALGYTSKDVLGYLGQANSGGLNDDVRRSTTLKGLTIARNTGLSTGEMAGVQSDLKRSMLLPSANAGQLDQDLSRFALVMSEAVKRGTGGPEMAGAFRTALAAQTAMAGGKLFEAQSGALMSQMLGVSRNTGPYMTGGNGVTQMQKMNETVGNMAGADRMFFYDALRGKTAKGLGYSGEQAGAVQTMIDSNPMLATGYMLRNGTNESRSLIADKIMRASGGNLTQTSSMLQGLGVDANAADWEAAKMTQWRKMHGGKMAGYRFESLDTWSGKKGQATPEQLAQAIKDPQGGNTGEGIARRQEANHDEIKVRASHVSFDNVTGQIAIQSVQSITLAGVSGKKEIQGGMDGHAIGNLWRGAHGKGYSIGGYTGNAGTGEVAGVVHGQEYVVNASATRQHRGLLERLNSGGSVKGFESGGLTSGILPRGANTDSALLSVLTDLNVTLRAMNSAGGRNDLGALSGTKDKSFFGQLLDTLKGGVGRAWKGAKNAVASAGKAVGGAVSGAVTSVTETARNAFAGSGGRNGDSLASVAMSALKDADFVDIAGRCSQFVRQVTERALGKASHSLSGVLFGASAIDSGNMWKKRGLTMTREQAMNSGGYKGGDVLFTMSGSGGYGHTGVVSADGKYVLENSTRGGGGKMKTPIEKFGRVDLVGRLGLDTDGDLRGDGLPPSRAATRAAPTTTTRHTGEIKVAVTVNGKLDSTMSTAVTQHVGNKIAGRITPATPSRARAGG